MANGEVKENNGKKAREIPSVFVDATPEGYDGATQIVTKYFGSKGSAKAKFECKVARLDPVTAGDVYANVTEDAIYQKATKNFWYEEQSTKVTIDAAITAGQSAEDIAGQIRDDLIAQYTAIKSERTSEVKELKVMKSELKGLGMTAAEAIAMLKELKGSK